MPDGYSIDAPPAGSSSTEAGPSDASPNDDSPTARQAPAGTHLTLSSQELLYFVERALRGMSGIVTDLGDELACRAPRLEGANTAYGLLTHCLGVMNYWAGALVAGREVTRDRPGEFTATGPVAPLVAQVEPALARFAQDVAAARPEAPLHVTPDATFVGPDRSLTQVGALLHVFEELAQHHGQLEILRDALLAETAATGETEPPQRTASPAGPADPTESADPADSADPAAAPLAWLRRKHGAKWHRPGPDLIAAWVADMDFPIAPVIAHAVDDAVRRGDLGYPDWHRPPLAEPFAHRMFQRYDWAPEPEHVRGITDLLQGVQLALQLTTDPGDGVIVFLPSYPPFLATIESMRRRLVPAPLMLDEHAGWTWDHDRLERTVAEHGAKALLLVNPHNPTGKVFRRDELDRIADLAHRHDLLVISDEIHADLTYAPARHLPFAATSHDAAGRTLTLTSASKAFNIAGLRAAVAHVGHSGLRHAWDAQPPDLFGATNVLGVEATLAAWDDGDAWLDRIREQLRVGRDHLIDAIRAIPGVSVVPPEATYLAWLDCAGLELDRTSATWLRHHAGLELSPGPDFGPGNEHRVRVNFATSTEVLHDIVDRLTTAVAQRLSSR